MIKKFFSFFNDNFGWISVGVAIILLILDFKKIIPCNSASNLIIAFATFAIARFNAQLIKTTQTQVVTSLMVAFQNEWHNPRAILMRDYLHSKKFEIVLEEAIEAAYGTQIKCNEIPRLLKIAEKKNSDTDEQRLEKFEDHLKDAKYPDPIDDKKWLFSAYQAIYEVLLSFDRLAVNCNIPLMMERCIHHYKPPIKDLSKVLQVFIAVRILLRPEGRKNYKKYYMYMLGLFDTADTNLFEQCMDGLKKNRMLTDKELKDWKKIQQKHS